MNVPRRLFLDVSYTRTQPGAIGITRTVRRLFDELRAAGFPVEPVAFHSSGFRAVDLPPPREVSARAPASAGLKLFQWLTGRVARRAVLLALRLLPWRWTWHCWRFFSAKTFDALTSKAPAVQFRPGDVLVIADASWNYPVWQAASGAQRAGADVAVLVYDLMPVRHPQFCFALVPPLFASFLRESIERSAALLCISKATEDDLRRWAGEEGLQVRAASNFRLGADVPVARSGDVRPALREFLDGPVPCYAAVGSFEPKKNYPMLLAAFESLWRRGERVRLVMAGRPTADCAALVQSLATHPGRGRNLMVLHDATDAEVQAIYAACRALVFPSLFEGFGLPLVEARSRGARVIASDIPSFVELGDAGVAFFSTGSQDALESALLHDLHGAAVPAGHMPTFTWADAARQFHARLIELLPLAPHDPQAAVDPAAPAVTS